jgi:membrane protease YdiL (CAAX protease family)
VAGKSAQRQNVRRHGVTTIADPFSFIRVRAIISVLILCILAVLAVSFPISEYFTEGYAGVTAEISVYFVSGFTLFSLCRHSGVDFGKIMGPRPTPVEALRISGLAFPLVALSLGSIWLVFLPLSYVAPSFVEAWLLEEMPLLIREHDTYPFGPNLMGFVSICVVVPFFEEFVFRGLVLHRWASKWTLLRAVVFSSVFFGVLHPDVLGSILFGLVAAVLYLETRSLYAAVILHATNNFIAYVMT